MSRALLILLVFAVAAAGCEKQDPTAPRSGSSAVVKPTVSTAPVTGVTMTTAAAGGEVTADGGAPVTARGVTWSTSPNPTVSGARTADGTGTGAFQSEITGLSPGGRYYVRSYAVNSAGTAYGGEVSFTAEEGEYSIIVLGRVNDYPTLANALNGECRVAGSWSRGGNLFGSYTWAPGTGFRLIGEAEDGSALAINEEGIVAGTLADRTYTWTEASGIRSYDLPTGFTVSMAGAINRDGVLAGESVNYGAQNTVAVGATLWRPDGRAVLLRNHLGGLSNARDINDAGVVVGFAGSWPATNAVAWRAPDEDPVLLPKGEQEQYWHLTEQAWGINNEEDIVGVIGRFAALWRGDQRIFLSALPGHDAATARSVTEPDAAGVIHVVGWSEPVLWGPSVERRPVIWTVDGSDIQVAELYPPAGHLGAIAKDVKVLQGEVVVVGTSYSSASAFAVMWSTSRDICGF